MSCKHYRQPRHKKTLFRLNNNSVFKVKTNFKPRILNLKTDRHVINTARQARIFKNCNLFGIWRGSMDVNVQNLEIFSSALGL
ncbi:MAG: tellurium resistance protein [Inoviridae sp.]|nr:MAG: tellurium resistance protein [Inoviridae sp.]